MNERARLRALDAGEVNDSVDDLWHMHLAVDSDEGNHSARVCVGERRLYVTPNGYGYVLLWLWLCLWLPMPMAMVPNNLITMPWVWLRVRVRHDCRVSTIYVYDCLWLSLSLTV